MNDSKTIETVDKKNANDKSRTEKEIKKSYKVESPVISFTEETWGFMKAFVERGIKDRVEVMALAEIDIVKISDMKILVVSKLHVPKQNGSSALTKGNEISGIMNEILKSDPGRLDHLKCWIHSHLGNIGWSGIDEDNIDRLCTDWLVSILVRDTNPLWAVPKRKYKIWKMFKGRKFGKYVEPRLQVSGRLDILTDNFGKVASEICTVVPENVIGYTDEANKIYEERVLVSNTFFGEFLPLSRLKESDYECWY